MCRHIMERHSRDMPTVLALQLLQYVLAKCCCRLKLQ